MMLIRSNRICSANLLHTGVKPKYGVPKRTCAIALMAFFAALPGVAGLSNKVLAGALEPVRISGYFNWKDNALPEDGDYRSDQRDAFPEILDISGQKALVRAVTLNGRTTLRILPNFDRIFDAPRQWQFSPDFSVPPEDESEAGGMFGAATRSAVIGSFGDGIYRVSDYTFADGRTCATAQIDLSVALSEVAESGAELSSVLRPITCRDITHIAAVGRGRTRTYLMFDGSNLVLAMPRDRGVAEIARTDLAAWLGDGSRSLLLATAQVSNNGNVQLATALDTGAGSQVCVTQFTLDDLRSGQLPKGACSGSPVFSAGIDSVVVDLSWRPDGRQLAIIQTDQKTRQSQLSLVEASSGNVELLSIMVLVPRIVGVPYVAKPTLAWIGNTIYWLEQDQRTSFVARNGGSGIEKFPLPENTRGSLDRCGMAEKWFKDLDLCVDADTIARRASEILGKKASVADMFDSVANFLDSAPAWIAVTCEKQKPPLVRVVEFLDVSWFAPFVRASNGRVHVVAAVVARIASNGVDGEPYTPQARNLCSGEPATEPGRVAPLPPVVRLAVFEVPQ